MITAPPAFSKELGRSSLPHTDRRLTIDLSTFDVSDFLALDLASTLEHLIKLALAFLLALPIAWDRESKDQSIGLRTFPLVAMASAGYILIARSTIGVGPEMARILQGLITGVGFLGGGAIVHQGVTVRGTATAAGIWSTAAVGAAVALGRLEIAVALTITTFLTLNWMRSLKKAVPKDEEESER